MFDISNVININFERQQLILNKTKSYLIVPNGAKLTRAIVFSRVACCSFLVADVDAMAVLASERVDDPLKCCITIDTVPTCDSVLGALLLCTKL